MRYKSIFIGDLHLDREDSAKNQLFCLACDFFAKNCQRLYILGDFWISWIGDDSLEFPPWQSGFGKVAQALANLGNQIYINFMVGNRDFTVGQSFYQQCNLHPISDPHVINLPNKKILLTHGDYLAIDDQQHIKTSKIIRDPDFIDQFMKKPISDRIKQVDQYVRIEHQDAYDINTDYALNQMDKYFSSILIHGHIHNPQVQQLSADKVRYVLHNWDQQAGMIGFDGINFELFDLVKIQNKIEPIKFKIINKNVSNIPC